MRYLEIAKKAVDEGRLDWFIMSCEYCKSEKMWIPLSFTKKARASPINAVAENPSSWENRTFLVCIVDGFKFYFL